MSNDVIIGIVGNPNCGKTTVFNALTGAKQQVGNWPGVTVEKKTGEYRFSGKKIEVVDLPGTYSLESADDTVSLDEKVARDYVASRTANLIINVVDAAHIERHLYLTSQLIEMRVPMIVVLNMMDVVKKRGIKIDTHFLSLQLGCPIVPISAARKEGIALLKSTINSSASTQPIPSLAIPYHSALENAIQQLTEPLTAIAQHYPCDVRWLALRLLEEDTLAKQIAGVEVLPLARYHQREAEQISGEEIDILAADARYGFVNRLVQETVCKVNEISRHSTERIDRIVLNRFLGIPIFLLIMYLMFLFTINMGGAFIDFFDQAVGAGVTALSQTLTAHSAPDWLVLLLAQGIGGGIQVVATFIPIVGFLFLFLSALEDSGYMARAAFVMDRFMRLLGLPGKSFVPMIVGFGCNVPAIMATRTLDNQRDRILTNLMNPFMSCGARLPVYALFAGAFFPHNGQNIVFSLYLLGILIAVLTGLIMRHTLFKGETTPFIMELPIYHLPTLRGMMLRTWDRLQSFLLNAGKLIVPMVLILNLLNNIDTQGQIHSANSKPNDSLLSAMGRSLTPLFKPIGIEEANWIAVVGIFTGVLAKEAVVGTLDSLYSQVNTNNSPTEPAPPFMTALRSAWQTIPEHLQEFTQSLLDPLGLKRVTVDDLTLAAEMQQVKTDTFMAMQSYFDGQIGAFAYLLFILLYTPCVAATAAIYRETNLAWTIFVVCWTTGLAYFSACLFYQTATYSQHPEESALWIKTMLTLFVIVLFTLKMLGQRDTRKKRFEALS